MLVKPTITLPSGSKMPVVGLGTFDARDEVMRGTLRTALEAGYHLIDTAYSYLNEDSIGLELEDWFKSGKLKRENIFITSKLPMIAGRSGDVEKYLKKTLQDLRVDYVDLYLYHNPVSMIGKDERDVFPVDKDGNIITDPICDLEGTWKALEAQVDAGRVKNIGISNFNSKQIERILKVARIKPANHQVEAHVYFQQRPLQELCQKNNITMTAFGPLGAPYRDTNNKSVPLLLEHPVVAQAAKDHNRSPGQILLRFLLQIGFAVVPKSATPSRIHENLKILDFHLNPDEMKALSDLDLGREGRVLSFKHVFPGIEKHPEYPFNLPF